MVCHRMGLNSENSKIIKKSEISKMSKISKNSKIPDLVDGIFPKLRANFLENLKFPKKSKISKISKIPRPSGRDFSKT